jgi:tRNA threonylcarbamoyladenosine biosynthesis protein TsaB
MRYILGIDTAGPEGSVALVGDRQPEAIAKLPPGGHSSGLSAEVARLLGVLGIDLDDVSAFAVNEGPGSFTGLRIGLAWAKGAAFGTKRPLVLVRAHDAMALEHGGDAEHLVTAIPGARGLVEAALWKRGVAVWEPETFEEGDLIPRLLERGPLPGLGIVAATPKLAGSLAEEAMEEGIAILRWGKLAPAVATIGLRLLDQGLAADLTLASPAYGREPNARKPGS